MVELPDVELLEFDGELLSACGFTSEPHELRAVVDPDDRKSPTRQRECMPPRAAPDVEHPHPGRQPERVDQELDLLLGALGERVPQVGGPEEVGDAVEPVPLGDRRRDVSGHGVRVSGQVAAPWGRSRATTWPVASLRRTYGAGFNGRSTSGQAPILPKR